MYWQIIEKRFRESDMSFMDSLLGLFSGRYDMLDFNVHLWFLPCFFVTVVLFNLFVNLGSRKIAYALTILMSLLPKFFWGFNRMFKYIGFYAVGAFLGKKAVKIGNQRIGDGAAAIVLLGLNFFLSYINQATGFMWFITAFIGIAAIVLIAQLIDTNRVLQYFGRISLIVLCIHGPVYRIVVKMVSIPFYMEILESDPIKYKLYVTEEGVFAYERKSENKNNLLCNYRSFIFAVNSCLSYFDKRTGAS